jgi:FkbM family methyltransferase
MVRFPSKTNTLRYLRRAQVPVGTIIDVGVNEQTFELRDVFPDVRHILFEPTLECHDAIRTNYAHMDYELVPCALSDQDGTGFMKKVTLGDKIDYATMLDYFPSEHRPDDGVSIGSPEPVPTLRLDNFMTNRNDSMPYLLKIDVDGHEMPVMRGTEGIWDRVSCVIVEVNVPSFTERMNFILSKGFRLFDIVDSCYYYDMFWQTDLVFVAEKFMDNPILRRGEIENWNFHWDQYIQVASFEAAVQLSVSRWYRHRLVPRLKWKLQHFRSRFLPRASAD